MVNTRGLLHDASLHVILTQPAVSLQNTLADNLPFGAITPLMSGLSWLVLLPAFAFVGFAVT